MFTLEVRVRPADGFTGGSDGPGPVMQLPCLAAFAWRSPAEIFL